MASNVILSVATTLVISSGPPVAPDEMTMPQWRQGLVVGEWREIQGSSMALSPISVVTFPALSVLGPRGKIDAWNGLAIDTRDGSVYSPANGGHLDYAGNEVNRIGLMDNAPKWSEIKAATPVAQIVANAAHYADGRPTSRHSYYGVLMNEKKNRIITVSGARWGDGYSPGGVVDGFNLTSKDWDQAGTFPDGPISDFGPYNAWTMVDETATGDLYAFANFSVLQLNNVSNTWVRKVSNSAIYGQYAASAFDTKRRRILVAGGNANDHGVYDLTTNTTARITFSGPQANAMIGDTGNGMIYEPTLDVYLLRKQDAGGTVYRINAENFSVDLMPTSGGARIVSTVFGAAGGVWRRFLYVPKLKGIVFYPLYDSNMWFLRTH